MTDYELIHVRNPEVASFNNIPRSLVLLLHSSSTDRSEFAQLV
jgi:hypothetical protein